MFRKNIDFSKHYTRDNLYIFLSALFSYIFVYGFELTHFTLSIDEEDVNNFDQTIRFGRWGHAFLKDLVFPEPYTPYYSLALGIFFLSMSSFLASKFLKLELWLAIPFVIMISALPQMAYQLEFSNQAETISLAILVSVCSLFFINSLSLSRAFLFVLLNILSLSIYQSVFLYSASLFLISLTLLAMKGEVNFRECLVKISIYSILASLAILINSTLAKAVANHYGFEVSNLSQMVGWGRQAPGEVIITIILFMKSFFNGTAKYGLNSFAFTLVPVIVIFGYAIKNNRNAILVTSLSIVSILSAFLLCFALGSVMAPRTLIQMPVIFAGLFSCMAYAIKINKVSLIISLFFLCVGTCASSKLFYSDYMARESDKILATQVIQTVYNKYPDFDVDNTPVFFYGSFTPINNFKLQNSDIFGASFFSWDGGNNKRMYRYLSAANIANLKKPNSSQVDMARDSGSSMPSWPNRGSVSMVDGVVIVKLSNQLSPYNR